MNTTHSARRARVETTLDKGLRWSVKGLVTPRLLNKYSVLSPRKSRTKVTEDQKVLLIFPCLDKRFSVPNRSRKVVALGRA